LRRPMCLRHQRADSIEAPLNIAAVVIRGERLDEQRLFRSNGQTILRTAGTR
jgi:hypothetical protein